MGKHRAKRHESRGALGAVVSVDSLKTLPEEEKLGLKRGIRFKFSRRVTADAYPFKGGRLDADFEAGHFIGSIDAQLKFKGKSVNDKVPDECQFFLHREQVNGITFSPAAD